MKNQIKQILKEHNIIESANFDNADALDIFTLTDKSVDLKSSEVSLAIKQIADLYGIKFIADLKYENMPSEITDKLPFDYIKKNNIAPYALTGKTLSIALSSLKQRDKIDYLRMLYTDFDFNVVLAIPEDIHNVIDAIFADKDFINYEFKDIPDNQQNVEDTIISKKTEITTFADNLISEAVRINATDIHLHPEKDEFKLFYRINGILQLLKTVPKGIYPEVISRFKIMASLDITKKNIPQDGSFSFEISANKFIDVRISFIPTTNTERVVLRILNHDKLFMPLKALGMEENQEKILTSYIQKQGGMILVNGPTGSGKTTTLYAALDSINNGKKNIITIEDPVEYNITGIAQMQVSNFMDFAGGLRSVLRQDPDVIMIGEIRDEETASIAIRSALTGHLVLSTLHTNNSVQAVVRLSEIGIKPYLVTSAVTLSVSQRLVRILCPHCKEKSNGEDALIKKYPKVLKGKTTYKAKGCLKCYDTGYVKREAVYEILKITPQVKDLINSGSSENEILAYLSENTDFQSLEFCILQKVAEGKTSFDEYYRILA